MSDTEPLVASVPRSSADEQDDIIPHDRNHPEPNDRTVEQNSPESGHRLLDISSLQTSAAKF